MIRKPLVLSLSLVLTAAACTTSETHSGDEAVKTEVKASPSPQATADGKQKDGSTTAQAGEAGATVEAKASAAPSAAPSADVSAEASVGKAVVAAEAVKGVSMEVTASRLNVRSSGTMAAPILRTISRGTVVSVIGNEGGFAKIAEGEYVSEKYLRNVTEVAPVKAEVAAAKAADASSVAAPDAVDSSKK